MESKYLKRVSMNYSQWIKHDSNIPLRTIPGTYDVRVNGRWICGENPDHRETDSYPVMLVNTETEEMYFCTKIIFHQGSYTHVESGSGKNTVRMRTTGEVTIY